MALFEGMTEAVRNTPADEFIPGGVWVRPANGTGHVVFYAIPERVNFLQVAYDKKLADARRNGFSEHEIWQYWAEDGGNGYTNLRSSPARFAADGLSAAVDMLLRRARGIVDD